MKNRIPIKSLTYISNPYSGKKLTHLDKIQLTDLINNFFPHNINLPKEKIEKNDTIEKKMELQINTK